MEADLVGKTLGDFEIETLLGQGSMARVYEAKQIPLRRSVALKVLEESLFTPGESVARFLREAEAMARLEHPNIVPVYAAGEQTPYYYFAMRLIRGGTLEEALRQGISCVTGLEWANDICRALAFAHGSGVLHRDLKPTNVLIHDGVALLADFGLARLRDMSTITQMGHVMGTPLYMSPEQTLGEAAGPAADCFALGVILYEMFTGRHPFLRPEREKTSQAEMRTRLFKRIQHAACPPPSALDPEIPRALEEVILRALARRPEDRFPDARAMQGALEEASRLGPGAQRTLRYAAGARKRLAPEDCGTTTPAPLLPVQEPQVDSLQSTTPLPSPPAPEKRAPAEEAPIPLRLTGTGRNQRLAFGRYRVIKEVGHGGQGVVYQAHDPVLDRTVALKVLRGGTMAEPRLVEMFWHEARVAARLQHPHIITIYDFGVERQNPFLTMQFVDGPSLDRLLEPQRPLPLLAALQLLIHSAEALGFAHQAGVLHLDVKPGNILIRSGAASLALSADGRAASATGDAPPEAVLTDFTMARLREAAKQQEPRGAHQRGCTARSSRSRESLWTV